MSARRIAQRIIPLGPLSLVLSLGAMACTLSACTPAEEEDRDRATIEAMMERAAAQPRRAEANFGYIHHFDANLPHTPGEPLHVYLPRDLEIEVDRIGLVISAMELHRCSATNELGRRPLLDLFIPSAHAHVPSSATRFGTPWVEDLLGEPGSARMAGGIAPPAGIYCELHVILAPADDDVINLTAFSNEEIEGHTLLVTGRYRQERDAQWQDFTWSSNRRQAVALKLVHPHSGDSPVSLSAEDGQVLFLLDKSLDLPLFHRVRARDEQGPNFEAFLDTLIERFTIYQYQ